ncbi:MAG TPA: hypothetical protein GX747_03595 [Tenericutes bacterium]|nr:hypothetical protein [Mycoplasmatota bacterium]
MGTDNAPQFGTDETIREFSCDETACTAAAVSATLSLDGTVPSGNFTLSDAGKVNATGLKFNGKYCFAITDNKVEPTGSGC